MPDFNVLNPKIALDFGRLVPGASAVNYSSLILRGNPVLYYRFQEFTGSLVVKDSTTYQNDGQYTVFGVTHEYPGPIDKDKHDTAVRLDGGYINVDDNSPSLNTAFSEFSVELWVKIPDAMPGEEATLVGRGMGPGPNNFQLSIIPDGRVKFWFAQAASHTIAYSDSPLMPNIWYHVAATWDGSQQIVYVNGFQGQPSPNPAPAQLGTDTLQVGAYNNASRLPAVIDELAIYRRALAREEIITRPPYHRWNNQPPLILATSVNGQGSGGMVTIYQGQSVHMVITADDPDAGDTLFYQFSLSGYIPEFGPQPSNQITVSYPEVGTFQPIAFVSDGIAMRSAPFAKVKVERIPNFQAINDFYTTGFQRPVTMNVLANDSYPVGISNLIDAWTQPEHGQVTLNPNQTFTYTPNPDFQGGSDAFAYTITNGQGAYDTATVTIQVAPKKPPAINNDAYYTGMDRAITMNPAANDVADPITQSITIMGVQSPSDKGGLVEVLSGTQVRYTPPSGFHGVDTFVYQAEDEDGLQGSATVTVTVSQQAQVPFKASNDYYTVDYEKTVTLNVLANDSTPYPQPLRILSVTQPSSGGSVVVNGANTALIFTAAPGFVGGTSFTYTMWDTGANQDSATVFVTVRNDPPVAGQVRKSTPLDTPLDLAPLAAAYDREGGVISLVSFQQPAHGVVSLNPDGQTLHFVPAPGFRGETSFKYVIADEIGQQATGTAYIAVDFTMTIMVGPKTVPVTESISYSVAVSGSSGFDKSYTYHWDFGDGGGIRTNTSGTYKYSGIGNFTVTCTVRDSYGVERTMTEDVEVGANRPPVAVDYYTSVAQGKVLNINPRVNDYDPDGDRFFIVPYQGLSARGGFVATNTAGTPNNPYDDYFTYQHPSVMAESPFIDSFKYTIEDEYGLRASAYVYVTVIVNQPPVAADIYRPVIYNTPTPIHVLQHVVDPEGDALTVVDARDASNGEVTIAGGTGPGNHVLFTPEDDFLGTAHFVYEVRDTFQNLAHANVTLPVFGQYYPKMVYEDQPVAFWPFNETSGHQAYDMMAGQRTGTYVNQVVRGELGPLAKDMEPAANVDRGSIALLTGGHQGLGFTAAGLSVELWFKNTGRASKTILSEVLGIGNDGQRLDYTLRTSGGGAKILSVPDIEIGEWYHVVATYDGAWVTLYLDGVARAAAPHTGNATFPNNLMVGAGMSGQVSMLALYDKPLGAQQVKEHYQEALGPVVSYNIQGPDKIDAGAEFFVTILGRDVTGKTVSTEDSRVVTITAPGDPSIRFDADLDGDYDG